jgi:hypothetical protein
MRPWESVISYEDRARFQTSRWRLTGVRTREAAQNTADGVLWLHMTRAGNAITANLYKDDALGAGDKVASGTADGSTLDGTAEHAVELTLAQANNSGLAGSFWVHQHLADACCPLQAALCVDEDLDALWDGIEDLPGYDAAAGMAEFIRLAGEDVLARVTRLFADQLDGQGGQEAWFITDACRSVPDLRRVANPGQLRLACACRALEVAIGRNHQRAGETAYSALRDTFAAQYARAMESLTLTFKGGVTGCATEQAATAAHRLSRT